MAINALLRQEALINSGCILTAKSIEIANIITAERYLLS